MTSRYARAALPLAILIAGLSVRCNTVLDLGANSAPIADAPGPVGACNVDDGLCVPGGSCAPDDCTRCVCDDAHAWLCAPTCPDAGGDCPTNQPRDHEACSTTVPFCSYDNGCGGADVALCVSGGWQLFHGRCPSPTPRCPDEPPPARSPCSGTVVKCAWRSPCGGWFTGVCDGHTWNVSPPTCTPGTCPTFEPPPGGACSSGGLKCEWSNACGTSDYGFCEHDTWRVATTCAPTQCPPSMPMPGVACSTEGAQCSWTTATCEAGTHRRGACIGGKWSLATGCD